MTTEPKKIESIKHYKAGPGLTTEQCKALVERAMKDGSLSLKPVPPPPPEPVKVTVKKPARKLVYDAGA